MSTADEIHQAVLRTGQAAADAKARFVSRFVCPGLDDAAAADLVVDEFMRGHDLARRGKALEHEASTHARLGYVEALAISMPSPVRITLRRLLTESP